MEFKKATPADIPAMLNLIFAEGPNQYNYLPVEPVTNDVNGITTGTSQGILVKDGDTLAGLATYVWGKIYPKYDPNDHGYIMEVVVAEKYRGQGLGPILVQKAIDELVKKGYSTIFIKRHAENAPSARMMEKCGFQEVETYYDPLVRSFGNRSTTVCRFDARGAGTPN